MQNNKKGRDGEEWLTAKVSGRKSNWEHYLNPYATMMTHHLLYVDTLPGIQYAFELCSIL